MLVYPSLATAAFFHWPSETAAALVLLAMGFQVFDADVGDVQRWPLVVLHERTPEVTSSVRANPRSGQLAYCARVTSRGETHRVAQWLGR